MPLHHCNAMLPGEGVSEGAALSAVLANDPVMMALGVVLHPAAYWFSHILSIICLVILGVCFFPRS